MNTPFYAIRNYRPEDFDSYLQLLIEAGTLEPTGRCPSPQILSENLHRPNYSPEQDLFVVETAGNIVGYMDITPELKIGQVILNCFIRPVHRRQGLASKLLDSAIHRAKELEAKVAYVNVPQDNAVAKIVLSRLGFRFVRCFLELGLDVSKVRWPDIDEVAPQFRHLQRGEEDKLTHIQNLSFAGTWGYNPNTVAEIIYYTNLGNSSPEDVILAYDGSKVTGYCWTKISCKMPTHEKTGQIFMLGMDPDYKGKGIGKRVLVAGLSYLKSKGLQVFGVTVDSENKVACALYRSIGFEVRTSSLWYEKKIS